MNKIFLKPIDKCARVWYNYYRKKERYATMTITKENYNNIIKAVKERYAKNGGCLRMTNTKTRNEYFRLLDSKKWKDTPAEVLLVMAENKYGAIDN